MNFDDRLAPYAAHSAQGRGRRMPEAPAGSRSEFQRDRDRIIHSTAFRRLEYKTQVFLNHEGDLFRTRLTHCLEVAQIGRTLARSLQLNEDLVEAIALAHDLGHTPFGHAGQDVLNDCMREHGGFEHNLQSLRVVDSLEERYGAFDGLNLMFETREGILKHCSLANARQLGELGKRFLERTQPSLEAQLTNLADEIAYNNHDIDDGLRSGLITMAQMEEVDLFARHRRAVEAQYPGPVGPARAVRDVAPDDHRDDGRRGRHLGRADREAAPRSIDDVRAGAAADPLLRRDEGRHHGAQALPAREPVPALPGQPDARQGQPHRARTVRRVHDGSGAAAAGLPGGRRRRRRSQARKISDYIAGMTDRYAIREHRRIFSIDELYDMRQNSWAPKCPLKSTQLHIPSA